MEEQEGCLALVGMAMGGLGSDATLETAKVMTQNDCTSSGESGPVGLISYVGFRQY